VADRQIAVNRMTKRYRTGIYHLLSSVEKNLHPLTNIPEITSITGILELL